MWNWSRLRALWRNVVQRTDLEPDLADELQSYVDLVEDEQRQAGVPPEQAHRLASVQLGGAESIKEHIRAARAGAGLERLRQDVGYALRNLRRNPGFTTAAILLLAIGIGATTVVFSVVDAAVFKPLPYKNPDQLVEVARVSRRGTADEATYLGTLIPWTEIDAWRRSPQLFSHVAALGWVFVVTMPQSREPLGLFGVSPELFPTMGVAPTIGRWLSAEDAGHDVVLLSEAYWKQALGGDRAIVGRPLMLNGRSYTVVGVMPATFSWKVAANEPQPFSTIGWVRFDEAAVRALPTGGYGTQVRLRLRDGLALADAQRELNQLERQLHADRPATQAEYVLYPLDRRWESAESRRTSLLVLLAAVSAVLLIACINVANLMLSRLFAQRRELAVRSALGATAGRLVRQCVTEAALLALAGGLAAVGLAVVGTFAIPALVPTSLALFAINPMVLDLRTLAWCGGAMLTSVLLCGVVPALQAARSDPFEALQGHASVTGPPARTQRMHRALLAVQVALTVVLLAGAGLLAMSFLRMMRTDAGYDVNHLATARINLTGPGPRYRSWPAQVTVFDDVLARLNQLPGVTASYGAAPPDGETGHLVAFGHESDAPAWDNVSLYWVDPNYFSVVGIPLKAGRWFTKDDGPTGPPVAVVDDRAAALKWPGQSPIGQRFRYGPGVPWITVVGVVGHVKTKQFTSAAGTVQAYFPTAQNSSRMGVRAVTVRADDPSAAIGSIGRLLNSVDAHIPLERAAVVSGMYNDVFVNPRFFLVVMLGLAAIAVLTTAIGLYGVLNYSVRRRAPEIGVRLTLGASPQSIQRLILGGSVWPLALGLGTGVVVSMWLSRYLRTVLYDTTPYDVKTQAAVIVFLLTVCAIAMVGPARRAARVDPVETLKRGE
jgi:putative ABC transport system permease protein